MLAKSSQLRHRSSYVGLACELPSRPALLHTQRLGSRRSPQVTRAQVEVATDSASQYFVAMNNFRVLPEMCSAFEERWKTRESHLKDTPGFKRFALLKCDVEGEYVSYSSWESRQHFQEWTKSQSFNKAHGKEEGKDGPPKREQAQKMMAGPPTPKFYESVTTTEC